MTLPLQTVDLSTGLGVVSLIGYSLLSVIGLRFGVYAVGSWRANAVEAQEVLWEYLAFAGLVAALFGALGLGSLVVDWLVVFRDALLLGFVLILALAMRESYSQTVHARSERDRATGGRTLLELGFVAVVLATVAGAVLSSDPRFAQATVGVAGTGFMLYGAAFEQRQTADAAVSGTMLDSLVRHLLVVLVFAGLLTTVELARAAMLDPAFVESVRATFVVMTATALMTATIKLRQAAVGL